jgi:hypothetical protein
MIHVVPNEESHRLDTTCDCGPRVEFLEQILVIHNCEQENGWLVVESEDNYPTGILEDGVMVEIEE